MYVQFFAFPFNCTDSLTPVGGPVDFLCGVCTFSFVPAWRGLGVNTAVCLSMCPRDKPVTCPGRRTAGTASSAPHNLECRRSGNEMRAAENRCYRCSSCPALPPSGEFRITFSLFWNYRKYQGISFNIKQIFATHTHYCLFFFFSFFYLCLMEPTFS